MVVGFMGEPPPLRDVMSGTAHNRGQPYSGGQPFGMTTFKTDCAVAVPRIVG